MANVKGAGFTMTGEAIERMAYVVMGSGGEDFSFGLSPENTVRDFLTVFYEKIFEAFIGNEILDKPIGESVLESKAIEEAFAKIENSQGISIFEQVN